MTNEKWQKKKWEIRNENKKWEITNENRINNHSLK